MLCVCVYIYIYREREIHTCNYICLYIPMYIYIYIYIDRKVSCDVMVFGSCPIRLLSFEVRSFKCDRPMRKMIDDNHIT